MSHGISVHDIKLVFRDHKRHRLHNAKHNTLYILRTETKWLPICRRYFHMKFQATSHYLNQRWPTLLTQMCLTPPGWVNLVVSRNGEARCFICKILHVGISEVMSEFHNKTATKLVTSKRMMTSSNGNIFRVTGPLCGEFHHCQNTL